ncbi:NAD-dependent epimerase/dehydratase family protein [Paraglaciecola psychrophila]|uniref:NAD-dependent epimerase/dehydratase domain-containing protein n=1 Tax=Paraglaciecola psychrophila 170 TaxID=1129794 RepID=K7A969_9ALTE|nr:NAD-dependent epimerase/dehydratase family protein [Paraglaciecola psychrophila]AGH43154.1 hypothetical protein C427_1045 [Paraglaciecola psychrophila 170]GAC38832.1 hypothetical protein GPSY_3221 [Paraglaciecola psychrophila 170]
MTYLVTGAAGFNSNFITPRLYRQGHDVIGLDHLKSSQINVFDPIDLFSSGLGMLLTYVFDSKPPDLLDLHSVAYK